MPGRESPWHTDPGASGQAALYPCHSEALASKRLQLRPARLCASNSWHLKGSAHSQRSVSCRQCVTLVKEPKSGPGDFRFQRRRLYWTFPPGSSKHSVHTDGTQVCFGTLRWTSFRHGFMAANRFGNAPHQQPRPFFTRCRKCHSAAWNVLSWPVPFLTRIAK